VGNPHNLGAITRSCAHFGVSGIIMKQAELLQSGAALRTAEGGGEFVDGLACDNLPLALQLCKEAGYTLITTSSHGGSSLYKTALPAKVVIVFGEEMFGVSKNVAKSADIAVQIPGSGKVESLNVSVAASLILGEWYRQQL
jgi:RNA methyltransferase, TrmH family